MPRSAFIELREEDLETLTALADFYHRSLRPLRLFVRLTGGAEIRQKHRFIAEESRWLKALIEEARRDFETSGQDFARVEFTPRSLVAFWGRLLSSLDSKRSRRRLLQSELERRERLAERLGEAARSMSLEQPELMQRELSLRRPIEAGWMREKLGWERPSE